MTEPRDPHDRIAEAAVEDEVDDEFAFHIEMRAKELEAEGLEPSVARRRATEAFGDLHRPRAECIEIQRSIRARRRTLHSLRSFLNETRLAGRALLRKPAFTALAVLTLGVGIGAVAAIFSLVDATLLKPLPYPGADRIVTVWETTPELPQRSVAPANFVDWQERSRTVELWSALVERDRTLTTTTQTQRVRAASVTRDFFSTLGAQPRLGRFFEDMEPGTGGTAVVLGHAIWQQSFGGDPDVLGRTAELDNVAYEVVGVAPTGFEYPDGVELWTWTPIDVPEAPGFPGSPQELRALRDAWFISVVGRLAPGVELGTAQSEMDVIAARLREEHPVSNLDAGVHIVGLQDYLVADFRTTVLLLLAAVALVLVIACANVANLLLVRAMERRRELSLRAALGATKAGLLRYHLAEGLALAIAGSLAGLGVAWILIRAADRWRWVWGDVVLSVDARVGAFVVGVAALTTIAFGILPALLMGRTPAGAFGGRGTASGVDRRAGRVRQWLLAAEVALAFTLVLSTGLTVRTVLNLQAVDLGFETSRLATVGVFLSSDHADPTDRSAALDEMARSLRDRRLATAVTVAGAGPLRVGPRAGLRVEGRTFPPGQFPDVGWEFVSPNYFETLGIEVLRGRAFESSDRSDTEPVAMVNATLAAQVFGDDDPIGQRINTGLDGQDVWVRVVGVAADTKNQGPAQSVFPTLYRPTAQSGDRGALVLLRLPNESTAAALERMRETVRTAVPNAAVTSVASGTQLVGRYTEDSSTTLLVLSTLAGLSLLLSAIGLYGVTSYSVTRRTRDLSVRLALGARSGSIVTLVVMETLRPCVLGLLVGLLVSLGLAQGMRQMLFDVAPYDPLTIAGVGMVMISVAVVASVIPALRASGVDPATTLRE